MRRAAYTAGLFSSHAVEKPVLIVGNLTAGGTGKTPLVVWFARQLSALGMTPGILSRGYGRTGSAPREVEEGSDWQLVGDEPVLLKRNTNCPTVVAADCVAGARLLAARGVDVIIADDGLQHLRLKRDCEIAVIDGARGLGNGALLPAGPLREPASRLEAVDAIVVNGDAQVQGARISGAFVMTLVAGKPLRVTAMEAPAFPGASEADAAFAHFEGQRVHAVAGIGNPTRFFTELRTKGVEVIEHPFPDHHALCESDLAFGDSLPVLMTEKDAVKCRRFADPRLWYVPVTGRFSQRQGQELLDRVLHKLDLPAHTRG